MNRLLLIIALAGLLTPASLLSAAPQDADVELQLRHCKQLKDSLERLVCYDKIANGLDKNKQKTKASLLVPETKKSTLQVANGAAIDSAISSQTTKPPRTGNIDNFGKKQRSDEPEVLESRIVGKFTGWKKGSTIELENGQHWKVLSQSRGYAKLNNPKISIKPAIFGSYTMRVEGLNASAKVRRVD